MISIKKILTVAVMIMTVGLTACGEGGSGDSGSSKNIDVEGCNVKAKLLLAAVDRYATDCALKGGKIQDGTTRGKITPGGSEADVTDDGSPEDMMRFISASITDDSNYYIAVKVENGSAEQVYFSYSDVFDTDDMSAYGTGITKSRVIGGYPQQNTLE